MPKNLIINTRPVAQSAELSKLLLEAECEVLELPLFEISPLLDRNEWGEIAANVSPHDWLVFTSANGVEAACQGGLDTASPLWECKIAAVGVKTAQACRDAGFQVGLVSPEANSESLADALVASFSHHTERPKFVLLRGLVASPELPQRMRMAGLEVVTVSVYDSRQLQLSVAQLTTLRKHFESDDIALVALTSGLAVRHWNALLQEHKLGINEVPLAVIGNKTAEVASSLGMSIAIVAEHASMESLVQSIKEYIQ